MAPSGCKKKAAPHPSPTSRMRLSRILRNLDSTGESAAVSLGQLLWWGAVALVIVVGLVLYFKYERLVVSLLS